MKRSRGRGRRQQNPVNRSYDSNGPDVRVRGTASQVYEKYQALARDAMSSGDRVMAENYQQHAEHYFRILQSFQPAPSENEKEGADQAGDTSRDNGANGTNGADGETGSGDATTAGGEDGGNGAEPLVLVRENDGDENKSEGKSRRRGPLGKKRAPKVANGEVEEVNLQAEKAEAADSESAVSGE